MRKIKLFNVSKKFKEEYVLNDINISFESGHVYGIVGRNASGKSVLFKIISGFLKPDNGRVLIDDIDIYKKNLFPKNMSVLIEKPNFLDEYTAKENLMLLAKIKNKIGEEEIEKWINLLEISPSDQKKSFKKYSVGTKQKVGIIQVLMEDDDVLILDEPFNGLDDKMVDKVRSLLIKEKEKGKLILLSSHNNEDIKLLCDEIYRISGGKIEKEV